MVVTVEPSCLVNLSPGGGQLALLLNYHLTQLIARFSLVILWITATFVEENRTQSLFLEKKSWRRLNKIQRRKTKKRKKEDNLVLTGLATKGVYEKR